MLILSGVVIVILAGTAIAQYQELRHDRQLRDLYGELASLCLKRDYPAGATVPDRLRACAHGATDHRIDDEFYARWKDPLLMAQSVHDVLTDKRQAQPSFECSTRTGLLIGMLRAQGYTARDVVIISTKATFPDHVVAEVWNEDGQEWEVQDPTYDVYFRSVRDAAERPSAHEIVAGRTRDVFPCRDGGLCGWKQVSDENLYFDHIRSYWNAAAHKDETGDWQLAYDPDRFNPYEPVSGITYCNQREKHCEDNTPMALDEPQGRFER